MKFKTTLRLFIVVCLLGGLVWLVERRFESTGERRKRAERILGTTAEKIRSLVIERGSFRVECVKRDGTWFLVKPLEAQADEGEVNRILSVLEAMPREEVITAAQRSERELTLEDYGLLKTRARFILGNELGRNEVLVGDDTPLGDLLYVKLAASSDVISTSRGIMNVIPEKIEALRDRAVLHGDAVLTTRLEIQQPDEGFVQLVHTDDGWLMQQPIVARADRGRILQVLDALYALQVQEFVWDAKVEMADAEHAIDVEATPNARVKPYGLAPDEAAVRITVWVNGDEVGKELLLGKQTGENSDEVYARRRDIDSIYTVQKDIIDVLCPSVNDLRDRNLFSIGPENVNYVCFQKGDHKLALSRKDVEGWVIVEPVQWKADDQVVREVVGQVTRLRVESFADGSQTNLVELGLDPPAYIVQVLDSCPEPAGENGKPDEGTDTSAAEEKERKEKQNRLWIGTFLKGRETVFVKFEDETSLFEVSTAAISGLGTDLSDPLIYRDRTMLALRPESIKRISLLKHGMEHTVMRDESGAWIAVVPATNQVDQVVVEDILFTVSNMRAFRIESHNPENLAAFGLHQSELILTLGLTGEEGIQKSLLMGFRSKTDSIYAMVQGQDVVFALEKGLVDRLTRNLTKPPRPQKSDKKSH